MPRQLPPLNALRAFEAAARSENFTRAAEELGVSQAAVSQQVKGLEATLGLKLFTRGGRRLVMTGAGRFVAEPGEPFGGLLSSRRRSKVRCDQRPGS